MQVKKQQLELDMEQQTGSKLGKEYIRLYIVTLIFHLYAEYIMWNAGLDEAQARIKIARRNISNLRYADDTTLMADSKEELRSLLMTVKGESEKLGLKLNIEKIKIMASSPTTSWQIEGEKMEAMTGFYFLGLQNYCRQWLQPWNLKTLVPWKKSYDKPRQLIKMLSRWVIAFLPRSKHLLT